MKTRWWVRAAMVVGLFVVALVALRYVTSVRSVTIAHWTVSDRVLGVEVVGGVGDTCYVAETLETTEQVQIIAECREPLLWLGGPAVGVPHEFEVVLEQVLDDRSVIDAFGHPAQRCLLPRCGRPSPE